jgi:biopolymer transport protein ExbD
VHSLAHRSRQRRRERTQLAGNETINLVPLVDILTSIVFFSLLTYRGELLAELTAYDLTLPPVVVAAPRTAPRPAPEPPPGLVVRIGADRLEVGPAAGSAGRTIGGVRGAALDTLGALAAELRRRFPAARDARVVPDDAVAYDDVIHVLERLRAAGFSAISLGTGAAGAPAVLAP